MLKASNRPEFEDLRARLKKAGVRVAALDKLIESERGEGGSSSAQADILIDIASAVELFHSPDGGACADLQIDNHRETYRVRSQPFRHWLARRYYQETGSAPGAVAFQAALNVLEAQAPFDGPERPVHLRLASHAGHLFLDLVDDGWRAVEIDATGWRIVECPPVRFIRTRDMRPLPPPASGGLIAELREFLNVGSDDDFILVVSWLLAALRDRCPYPLLVVSGEQGSAKSTFVTILRNIVDPNTAPLRALPRDDRDLFIAAGNAHVQAFDNVSAIPVWLSDTLCRLATGGGYATRQLHTDQDEALFTAVRPVILNGIEDVVSRDDLADRAIFLTLEPIPEYNRVPETALQARFHDARPRLLGALLDALSTGLRELSETRIGSLPRMADFTLWATACESTLWPAGSFMNAYRANRDRIVDEVIEADPAASALRVLMADQNEWSGTAMELLSTLTRVAGERSRSKLWPDSPRALSGRVRRCAAALRHAGLQIAYTISGHERIRLIHITRQANAPSDDDGKRPSASSASSAQDAVGSVTADLERDRAARQPGSADATRLPADAESTSTARKTSPLASTADDADANLALSEQAAGGHR
ncbi:hypothetical protein RDV64_17450 [Acuticoccus sp. MNP-M23]|uniref:hypothetical protein n=1 Tax=Acuticoccus sp. MNP-M23 TaxID=3072793 RepID=UPI00281633A4|nr:hypothetical protein [Acuticoccus sp. MNP-M23]WMS41837.1 hypothetical protein RDV64_17450 [Acuticoccus sp. MNP-M23]